MTKKQATNFEPNSDPYEARKLSVICENLDEPHHEARIAHENNYNIELDTKPSTHSSKFQSILREYNAPIRYVKIFTFNALAIGYFIWATVLHILEKDTLQYSLQRGSKTDCSMRWCDGYGMLLLLYLIIYLSLIYFKLAKPYFVKHPVQIRSDLSSIFKNRYVLIGIVAAIFAAIGIFLIVDSVDEWDRLRSLLGISILFGLGYAFSANRKHINWRTVITGVIYQFALGVFCIRISVGRRIFQCFGDKVEIFFSYTKEGSTFVFGDVLVKKMAVFAFTVLPVIIFFSFIVSILYYYGAMQWSIAKIGWLLQALIGSSYCESVVVAGNLGLGMTETPMLIRPYIKYLTKSEIHLIMSSGFATVSGTVLAAFISFGAEASHLITSTVMAAPATLAYSKLVYPELEKSELDTKTIQMEKSQGKSVIDAASSGAFAAIELICGITANLIAFVSFIAMVNGIIGWLGMLIGYEYLSLEWFFGKLLVPLAYIIGIPWQDCEKIGSVIALKTIINEFVAYEKLGELKKAASITKRSASICTFAICGFANFGSLGMMVGNLSTMCPAQRSNISSLAVRAMITGSIVCFLNACIAGLLLPLNE